MIRNILIVSALWLAMSASVCASPESDLLEKLHATAPNLHIEKVEPSPVEGFFQVTLEGMNYLYVSADAHHMFAGNLYEVDAGRIDNITEQSRSARRSETISAIPRSDMLIFAPTKTIAVVNVFTDVDCPYCRKFHLEVPELNRLGIEVRYLAYPRAGIDSETYRKMVSVWCSEDPRAALTNAKLGEPIPQRDCPNPVATQLRIGTDLGVTGTPALVLENGRLIPGYQPAASLARVLGVTGDERSTR